MARSKVKVAFITNRRARKDSYRKRKKGILKKVSELSILCGIEACAIISDPFDDSKSEIWPDPEGAKQVIKKYESSSVVDERRNMNQEGFIMQKITKVEEQVKKQRQENSEKEKTLAIFQYLQNESLPEDLSVADLKELEKLLEKKINGIEKDINDIEKNMAGTS